MNLSPSSIDVRNVVKLRVWLKEELYKLGNETWKGKIMVSLSTVVWYQQVNRSEKIFCGEQSKLNSETITLISGILSISFLGVFITQGKFLSVRQHLESQLKETLKNFAAVGNKTFLPNNIECMSENRN